MSGFAIDYVDQAAKSISFPIHYKHLVKYFQVFRMLLMNYLDVTLIAALAGRAVIPILQMWGLRLGPNPIDTRAGGKPLPLASVSQKCYNALSRP